MTRVEVCKIVFSTETAQVDTSSSQYVFITFRNHTLVPFQIDAVRYFKSRCVHTAACCLTFTFCSFPIARCPYFIPLATYFYRYFVLDFHCRRIIPVVPVDISEAWKGMGNFDEYELLRAAETDMSEILTQNINS